MILHRREFASWGFSIVGGADVVSGAAAAGVGNGVNGVGGGGSVGGGSAGGSGRPTEPIHVLFVVPESPAAKDAKLRYVRAGVTNYLAAVQSPRSRPRSRQVAILTSLCRLYPWPVEIHIIDWSEERDDFEMGDVTTEERGSANCGERNNIL